MNVARLSHRTRLNPKHRLYFRVFAFICLLVQVIIKFYLHGFLFLAKLGAYLTNWGMILSIVLFGMLIVSPPPEEPNYKYNNLFHLVITMQFVIVGSFWSLLSFTIRKHTGILYIMDVTFHTVPFMLILIEFFLNSVILRVNSLLIVMSFFVAYTLMNSSLAIFFGLVIYVPFDWQTSLTYITFLCILVFMAFIWSSMLYIQKVKFQEIEKTDGTLGVEQKELVDGTIMK